MTTTRSKITYAGLIAALLLVLVHGCGGKVLDGGNQLLSDETAFNATSWTTTATPKVVIAR